ncbi:N-acyl amino acid synthase FeeM domain-containing protein [Roseomonas chloroacetimidivorans]|uniref:N-acyl amino acid synthase FeeM domain-containing protein n=1 Tax=Roseomonas chloroacetimidivorans TaxID=1766656 RepID=UPI003C73531B
MLHRDDPTTKPLTMNLPTSAESSRSDLAQPAAPRQRRVVPGTSPRGACYAARLATSAKVWEDAYRLRYRSYLAGGFIGEDPSGMFRDHYDDLFNADTVVLYDNEVPVASVRVCLLERGTDYTSPAMDTFPEEVSALLNANPNDAFAGRAIEVTRLVRSPEAENNQGLVFLLYRIAGYIALCHHTQIFLACVRSNHAPFYKRLGYSVSSELRPYPGLSCKMLLMASDRQRYDQIRAKVPMMDPMTDSTHNLEGFYKGEPVRLFLTR